MQRLMICAAIAATCASPVAAEDAATAPAIEPPPVWLTTIEADPMTDEIKTTFKLEATNSPPCRAKGEEKPAIVLHCTGRAWTAVIQQDCSIGIEKQFNFLTRHDSEKAVRRIFVNLARNHLQIPDSAAAAAFVATLPATGEFRVQIEPYRDYPMTVLFQVAGLADAVKASGASCPLN